MKNKLPGKIAVKLISLRKSMGLTQQQVAEAIGVKRSTYAYYESDTTPSLDIIEKLAKIYNVRASYILFPEEEEIKTHVVFNDDGYKNESAIIEFATLTSDEQDFLIRLRLLSDIYKEELLIKLNELLEKSE